MSLRAVRREWVFGATLVAAVVAGSALYYSVRIEGNADYLTRRNYRALAVAGRQVQEFLKTASTVASRNLDRACWRVFEITSGEEACRAGVRIAEKFWPRFPVGPQLERALERQRLERRRGWDTNVPTLEFGKSTVGIEPRSEDRPCPLSHAGKAPDGEDAPGALVRVLSYAGADCTLSVTVRAQGAFDSLFKPFRNVFDSVTLLGDERRILLAIPGELPIERLVSDQAQGAGAGAHPPAGANEGAPAARPSESSVVETVTIASRRYQVFCQPLGPDVGSPPSGFTFASGGRPRTVCGLVALERFEKEKVAMNPYWLIALGSFLALGTLSWPFLKVASLGPTERLRLNDLILLALSLTAGCSLVTLLVLDATSYLAVENVQASEPRAEAGSPAEDLVSQVRELASQVRENFARELEDMRATLFALKRLPQGAFPELTEEKRKNAPPPVPSLLAALIGEEPKNAPAPVPSLLAPPGEPRYPFFRNALWFDRTGELRVQWSMDNNPVPPLNVADRAYFKNALNGRLWPVDDGRERFFLEPLQSRITGEFRVVLSTSTKALDGGPDPWVLTLAAKPYSVISPLLPPGFGFAVIDRDGRTLFHSGRETMPEENSFEEFDRNPRLMAAVFSRTEDIFNARYWGRDHLVHVSPVPRLPLFLVVFAEKNLLRTAHLELLSLCLAVVMALLVTLTLYGVGARVLIGRRNEHWLWPRAASTRRYLALAGLLLLFPLELARSAVSCAPADLRLLEAFLLPLAAVGLVVSVLAGGWKAPPARLLILMGAPLAGLVGAALAFGEGEVAGSAGVLFLASLWLSLRTERMIEGRWRNAGTTRLAYVAWGLACLLAVAIAPSFLLFRIAWERQMRLLVRHGQLDLARRLDEREILEEARAESIRSRDGSRGTAARQPGMSLPLADDRPGYAFLYASHFYGTTVAPDDAFSILPSDDSGRRSEYAGLDGLAELLPLYDGVSIRLRGLAHACAHDEEWRAGAPGADSGGSRLQLRARRTLGNGAYSIASAAPEFRVLRHPQPWLALAVMLVVVWALLRFLARRFFLLGFREPETIALDTLAGRRIEANLFVVCPPLADKQSLYARSDVLWVDLGSASVQPFDPQKIQGRRAIGFDRFEQPAGDPAGRKALLETLERLLDSTKLPVMILSELDTDVVLGAGGQGPTGDEPRRWSRLLGRFARIVSVDRGDPVGFKGALDAAQAEGIRRLPLTTDCEARRARLRRLFDTLWRECELHRQLQVVGRLLVREHGFAESDPEQLVRHLRERADGFYRALWACLSSREKLVLTQVACGYLVNPGSCGAISRLLARRLLVQDVGFRLVNRSFARFVMNEARPEEVAAWEQSGTVSLWAQMRVPVLISFVGVGAFLAYTQGDTLSTWVAAVGTAVPFAMKVADLLKSAAPLAQAASAAAPGVAANV